MAGLALALLAVYVALAFGARTALQLRRTGSTGFKGVSGRPGSAEWAGGVLFVLALGLGLAAPVLDLAGAVDPVGFLDGRVGHALGFVLYALGLAGTLVAQGSVGRSWRIGVDRSEKTDLVTAGPFAVVRNPIFSAMIPAFLGLALMVPNVCAIAGVLALVAAVELQVRCVEEPYLTRVHGERYLAYASRVGRFAPGAGKLRPRGDRP
jgi:protein-S-isoprenylcysteine O-methyltransferase Ste14